MTELLTEQEQVDQLKRWLRLYGLPALFGVLAGIFLFYGFNYYQNYKLEKLTQASRTYDEMLTDRAQNNLQGTEEQAKKLLAHYQHTPYASLAALMLAREALQQNKPNEAIEQLSWVEKKGSEPAFRQIARLRLARLYLAQQAPDKALKELKKVDAKNFEGLIKETLGDIYLAQKQIPAAREAYQAALAALPNSEETRPLLEMKLNNLATAG